MHVLVIGASGFIGAQVAATLHAAGHWVRAAVRDVESTRRRLAFVDVVETDMARSLRPEDWAPALAGIDAVVNCAGVLQASATYQDSVHHRGPAALFAACAASDIRRVIHISAVSADPEAGTAYAITKWRGEEALRASGLDAWVVLRPSLVWSPAGSYGGTSALRGLAALPLAIPLIGKGDQPFTPITVEDLARTVLELLETDAPSRVTLEPCGPETLTMREIIMRLRAWLGLPPARFVETPIWLVRLACILGDLFGRGPITTTSLRQLDHGNAADPRAFASAIGFQPSSMAESLRRRPAQEQDRWHARLFFVEPVLRGALALLWLGSGIAGLLAPAEQIATLVHPIGLTDDLAVALGRLASVADLLVGLLLVSGWRPLLLGGIQITLILGYTAALTVAQPGLWLAPLGPLLKNLPILAAVIAHTALARTR